MSKSPRLEAIDLRLHELALERTHPFCYSCYKRAPKGVCISCGSDDLMRELPGVGVDWGCDWVIKSIIETNLDAIDITADFEDYISECYPDPVQVLWMSLDPVSVAKEMDPTSWNMAMSEWLDSEVENEQLMTFDNGTTYYRVNEVEAL